MTIRVHKVNQLADGSLRIAVHGQAVDGEYVAGRLKNEKGVQTTEPTRESGTDGMLVYFVARGSDANPLTRQRVVSIMQADPEIELVNVD